MQTLYDERGVLSVMTRVLVDQPVPVVAALKMTVDCAIATLKVVELIYPERVRISGLDQQTDTLIRDAARAFRSRLRVESQRE
jgi:hypothetical protein